MSFRTNKSQQMSLTDSFNGLTERERRYLDKSWAKGFAEIVFPIINEKRFSVLYDASSATRPNTPVNVIVGALMLKELNSLTDDELLEAILFDIRYQYALCTTSYAEQPISDRTVSRFRERLRLYEEETGCDLLKEEMQSLAGVFAEYMGISGTMKRMDSLMIASNCKKMSRLELFYVCVSNFVRAVLETGGIVNDRRFERYTDEGDKNTTIYRSKPEDIPARISEIFLDAIALLEQYADGYKGTQEYEVLKRLIEEQSVMADTGRELKDGKEIDPGSMQNPSDPDATYRKKAGKGYIGYVGNVVETVDRDSGASIVTEYDYQPNQYHDSQFCKDVIAGYEKQEETIRVVADGAYYGNSNIETAAEKNIELVTTAMTGSAPSEIHKDFIIDEETKAVVRCPAGYKPTYCWHNKKRDDYRLTFDREQCENCPHQPDCKSVIQKKYAMVKLSAAMVSRSAYQAKLGTDEYQELARFRNGVEGVPSILRRRYHVDEMPVYGLLNSKMWFSFKIGAVNIKKVLAWVAMACVIG